jgi:hypothetical protein
MENLITESKKEQTIRQKVRKNEGKMEETVGKVISTFRSASKESTNIWETPYRTRKKKEDRQTEVKDR